LCGERPLLRHVEGAAVVGGDLVGGSLSRGASSGRRSSLETLTLLCCAWLCCAQEMRYFTTGSYAEFHDPYLRRLLALYVRTCEGEQAASRVETDVAAWHAAVTQYKNVVTHFFAYKTEQWHNRFLLNTLGVEEYQGVYEFAKMRGAIHYHSSASTQGDLDCLLDTVLATLCVDINHTLKKQEGGGGGIARAERAVPRHERAAPRGGS
jgi:hypothetical protein